MDEDDIIRVFTDGSCYPNPNGHGGWSFTAHFRGKGTKRYGYQSGVTNNLMELRAIERALTFIPASLKHTRPLEIRSDSEYCVNALTKWWRDWRASDWKTSNGKPVQNRKVLSRTLRLIEAHRRFREVRFVWVKGHAGILGNELVDKLANHARKTRRGNWRKTEDCRTDPITSEEWEAML